MFRIPSLLAAIFALVAVGSAPKQASAGVFWDWDGSQLKGAFGINIEGTIYDVEFVDDRCDWAFDGCDEDSDFPFASAPSADLIGNALLDQVLVNIADGAPADFDANPDLIAGCERTDVCKILSPWHTPGGPGEAVIMFWIENNSGTAVDTVRGETFATRHTTATRPGTVLARFTIQPVTTTEDSAIPVPGTMVLLGGAIAFVAVRRRVSKA